MSHQQPTCRSEPDEDHTYSTLVDGAHSPTNAKKPATTTVSASSDSGYSSRTAASSKSKASTGKTAKPLRPTSAAAPPKAKSRSSSTDATKKTSAPSATKTSRPSSRSQSQVRKPGCGDPNCHDPNCSRKSGGRAKPPPTLESRGFWPPPAVAVPVLPSPSPMAAPYNMYPIGLPAGPPPQPVTYNAPMRPPPTPTYSVHPSQPPPARPRPRLQSFSQSRPHSFAGPPPQECPWPQNAQHDRVAHPPQAPDLRSYTSSQVTHIMPENTSGPVPSSGIWVREAHPQSGRSHPAPPPEPPHYAMTRTMPQPMDIPSRRSSMYGGLELHQGNEWRGTSPYQQYGGSPEARRAMPPPPLPRAPQQPYYSQLPPRRESRGASAMQYIYDDTQDEVFEDDPYFEETIRPKRASSRPTIAPHQRTNSRSSAYHQDRYAAGRMSLERSVSRASSGFRPSRQEKLSRNVDLAREYQEGVDSRARFPSETFEDQFEQLHIGSAHPTGRRQSLVSRHERSRSRAGSSISHPATDVTSAMKLTIMDGNAIQIEGDTEGRTIQMSAGENGQANVAISGTPSSPMKLREKRYYGGGSQRSGASFAERTGARTGATSSPIDGQTLVSEKQHRRRSAITPR